MTTHAYIGLLLALAVGGACGGGDDDGGGGGGGGVDAGGGGGGDCDPVAALPSGWQPVDALGSGSAVSVDEGGGVVETIIDARAGGFMGSDDEAFLYVTFGEGSMAVPNITDVESFDDDGWHLGFKRYVIRANGGDSGPGGVSVAQVEAAALEDVTAAPADGEFSVDKWTDGSCFLVGDGIGGPRTQFTDWYDIAEMILTPRPLVYVVRVPDDGDWAIEIEDYYAGEDPEESGVYRVRWARLE